MLNKKFFFIKILYLRILEKRGLHVVYAWHLRFFAIL